MQDHATPGGSPLLKSLPGNCLPREKLMQNGRASLTDEELIAIFLRTGLQGCNVLELASIIKKNAGSLAALGRLEAPDIAELCKGIGPAKAATLAAVFELGQRAAREIRSQVRFDSPRAVYDYLVDKLRFEDQEHMYVLLLNTRRELIRAKEVGLGTLTRLVVHPRDIFRDAVRYSASCIILAHNHPSGNPQPSKQDTLLTEAVMQAAEVMCIPLADHVIIGAPGVNESPYYSFAENRNIIVHS